MAGFPIPTTPDVYDLPTFKLRIIRALRLVAVATSSKADHRPELDRLFGSENAANAFLGLLKRCSRH